MAHIKLESEGSNVRLQIDGNLDELADLIAQAMIKEPMLGLIMLEGIKKITENPFNNINLN